MNLKSPLSKNAVLVFYVGTRKISLFISDLSGKDPRVLAHKEILKPAGFENGCVVNLEAAVSSIEALVSELIPKRNQEIQAYVVLGNAKLYVHGFSSSQYFSGQRSVTSHDIRSVIEQTRSVATLPLTEFVLQIVPESFLVNDTNHVTNPTGLDAIRLGVNLKFFTMDFQEFRNISKAFEAADVSVRGYWPRMLTVSESVLTEPEMEEGVILVDITDHVTHLTAWKGGTIRQVRNSEFGGKKLSQDISERWGIDPQDAEKIKENFATMDTDSGGGDEIIPLVTRNGKALRQIRRQDFQDSFIEIAKEWVAGILKEMDDMAAHEKIHYPHCVVTGGGVRFSGFIEFLNQNFGREARIGLARGVDAPQEKLVDPSVAAVYGMYRWLGDDGMKYEQLIAPRGIMEKTLSSAKDWFCNYF